MISQDERAILEARARALAKPVDAATSVGGETSIVFSLARERYAIEARFVHAAFRLRQLARMPGAKAPVVGVTRWRGDVITLIDIRTLVGAPATALDDLAIVLIIGDGRPEFGLLADTIAGTSIIATGEVLPPQRAHADDVRAPIVRGVTRDAVLILDAPRLIARQMSTAEQPSGPSLP